MPSSSPSKISQLLGKVRHCRVCEPELSHGPRPVVEASRHSKIAIIGQAPGSAVHQSGVPWDDPSGDNLRKWMGLDKAVFYDTRKIALVPMGFCYPGKGKSGDLPPRPECAPLWHAAIFEQMPQVQLTLLVGKYAQDYYLESPEKTLTDTVRQFRKYLPRYFVLPHPSPRNNIWQAKNRWFSSEVLPELLSMTTQMLMK